MNREAHIDVDLQAAIEALCQRGCRQVTETIRRLERGEVPAELAAFDPAGRAAALAELRDIMAVYQAPCEVR